ncbi:hypothetical protein V6N12_063407 [Hibiscus sabdariffa]|uniref:Protein kinase domain-containing protein n=1 Tax=Hibiscus sabdariffa TaxID=183260 RepID=A0ABR2FBM0_9ROSI
MQLIRTWHIEDSKLLVYEYMENQSLDRWLHGNKRSPISGMNSVHHAVLDWPRSNILLDSEFDAKIADFGLAKMLTRHASAHSMSIVAGSSGYLAPINLNGFKLGGEEQWRFCRQQRDSRTPNKKATTHMQQRDETDWNEEATIHICDENTIHSYFSGKKAPYTGVVENYNLSRDLKSFLFHATDKNLAYENYNLSRDLKSFLFHATDKNLAYVSPRFLLGSQSFVMDASERSKFIVNLECWRCYFSQIVLPMICEPVLLYSSF